MTLTFPELLFLLTLSCLLLAPVIGFLTEMVMPALRHPESGYRFRLLFLSLQHWLSLTALLALLAISLAFIPQLPVAYWLLSGISAIALAIAFWLRKMDLARAVRSVHWPMARKKMQQLQALQLIQISIALGLMLSGVEFSYQ